VLFSKETDTTAKKRRRLCRGSRPNSSLCGCIRYYMV
jgi:hypothetical protein